MAAPARGLLLAALCVTAAALQAGRTALFQSPVLPAPGAVHSRAATSSQLRTPQSIPDRTDRRAAIQAVATAPEASKSSALGDAMWSYVRERGGDRVIRKILIANNGMAATKTIMSIRSWAYKTFGDENAVEFVVMATPEDLAANAEFIRRANEFVEVPGGSNANNYANVQLIVDLAIANNVDAVMVGWGHASENPKLGDLLKERMASAGKEIAFVGPTSQNIRVLGDKIGSILLAQAAGVSTMPWNGDGMTADLDADGNIPFEQFDAACIHSLDEAIASANIIGYPVMLKASEGGGGKGIRKAVDEEELRTVYPQVLGEVPGSPVFLVTLCQGARHLEVQVVGDHHGNAIALGGRDCSTQRRFQKIFEEGPPIVASDEDFEKMMREAVQLCRSIGYRSAGTVEWMYIPSTGKYYFLELNPRLQVEHPVTEGITGVSLPATQIQVAMGIPLYNLPDVRNFYEKDPTSVGEFDLNYFKPSSAYPKHLIAARITAENPDEGFKPTSGKIDRINFQSDTRVWGYFSVVADGGVHEYADSQFGHLFATGDTREEARKALVLALKELFIMGDIRTTVEYLSELLETDAFKDNTLDTAWLDGLIATKAVTIEVETEAAVLNAAIYRGYKQLQDSISTFKGSLEQGQLSTLPLRDLQGVPVEITYNDVRYSFTVSLTAPDMLVLRIGSQEVEVRTREQADGSLYVSYGSEIHQIFAKEEPLGLRMILDGSTVLLPTIYDPSELRSDITGKLVRYLTPDGAQIEAGAPYAEAEAMKMLITIKAGEAGTIKHELSAGSIINQGDLLASLALKDPSKVKKIETFSGELGYQTAAAAEETTLQAFRSSQKSLELVMDGYVRDPEPLVQRMLSSLSSISLVVEEVQDAASALGNKLPADLDRSLSAVLDGALAQHIDGEDTKEAAALVTACEAAIDAYIESEYESKREGMIATLAPVAAVLAKYKAGLREHALVVVCGLLQRFMSTETSFAGMPTDQAIAALLKATPDDLDVVYRAALAHDQLGLRLEACTSLLRQLFVFPERFGVEPLRELPPALDVVVQMSRLPGSAYKELALPAAQFGLFKAEQPFDDVVADLKAELAKSGVDSLAYSRSIVTNSLIALFPDPDVGETAMQLAVKRMYRTWDITDMTTAATEDATLVEFKYQSPEKSGSAPLLNGMLAVIPELSSLDASLPKLLERFGGSGPEPVNSLLIATKASLEDGSTAVEQCVVSATATLQKNAAALREKGVRIVSLLVPNPPKWPRVYQFPVGSDYAEDTSRRNLRPTMYDLLELDRLTNWSPTMLPSISHNTIVMLGKQGVGRRAQQRLFVRGVSHSEWASNSGEMAEAALLKSLDELQLAYLDKSVVPTASSHLFLHILPPVASTPAELLANFKELMSSIIAKHATRLLKLSVDEIEISVHAQQEDGTRQAVRLMASSMSGQWLKLDGYLEYLDPVTGVTTSYCTMGGEGEDEVCFLEPYPVSSELAAKRATARRIGTTYAYDFLGLIEKGVVSEWQKAIAAGSHSEMPSNLLEAEELLLSPSGELSKGTRVVGTNTVGMVGFETTLKTPEYPEGRPLVIIANDCTVQSGSFGVAEDEYFNAASKYARAAGLPRLHLACNSGARIGLAEELKPYFKVAWKDDANVAAGFDYLYLTEEDVARFPEGTFHGEVITEGGEKRYKLDDIVGEKDGIGVENLRGSGLIAGETSAAYDSTFTLSYVTGRSVGIGAYINRLAQRVIQMQTGPMILTGFSALNKLLGKEVYISQDQLGGPQIMLPNGVAHQLAKDDQDGVEKILNWLSFVPRTASEQVAIAPSADPLERPIGFTPTPAPYDPRHMLGGTTAPDGSYLSGFFDQGSFTEYLAEWGKSVVVGRARLGGVPMGVIAVETRLVEQRIPADPANPKSRETVLAQAGQVWYPDSAYKTAQAIADFNHAENLPLIVFANWRGFSGGTRDMFGEVLKFGSYIVDNLRTYKHPVFAYIPPCGELRGGAWVVIDPTINEDMMEMYADDNARGGILEPPGICDVKFRKPDLLKKMHSLDPTLLDLDHQLEEAEASLVSDEQAASLRELIRSREATLLPLYTQISYEFADLHDRPGRMLAKGVIRDVVPWQQARQYFGYRVRRRLAQDGLVKQIREADASLSHAEGVALLRSWTAEGEDWEDDTGVLTWFEQEKGLIADRISSVRLDGATKSVKSLLDGLTDEDKKAVLGAL